MAKTSEQVDLVRLAKDLNELFEPKDKNLADFYLAWIQNDLVAYKAYAQLKPKLNQRTTEVLGSRQLSRIMQKYPHMVLAARNLGAERWLNQLDEGLKADKWNDFTGEREADHKTRLPYHSKLGSLLGLESDATQQPIQIAFVNNINTEKQEFGI